MPARCPRTGLAGAGAGWEFTVSVMSAPRVLTAASPAAIEIAVCRSREQTIGRNGGQRVRFAQRNAVAGGADDGGISRTVPVSGPAQRTVQGRRSYIRRRSASPNFPGGLW
ncbi:hypothetical protein Skr01_70030 [Sphaerisporangium krabiense]|nr:hypothetical protein Skr01_70030 [Sphaerisporangium krabiense]